MISGSCVAIVTPMHADGSLDLPRFRQLIDWHIAEGTEGIVVVGTTGESPTVNVEEHCELIRVAVQAVDKRVPVVAGTGGNSTAEAIELTAYAKDVGADACLSVVPYYNKPTQEGQYRHFRTIAEKVDLPLILYNVPGRTVADLAADTVLRLAEVPNIVGLKDATGDLVRHVEMMRRFPAGKPFAWLTGNDDTALAYMLLGGHGVISVTANVAPRAMRELCDAARAGRLEQARELNAKLMPLHTKLFVEANPVPVKWALAEMGKIERGLRLPLVELGASWHDTLRGALREAGVLA
jgi:4-hydroxy-tetrahydrodipicolinate synthase